MSISLCGNTAFYQWDVNQRLRVSVDAGTELHFANADTETALVLLAYEEDGKVYGDVPNIFLQTAGTFTMYYYLVDGEERHTSRATVFDVLPRKRPDNYVYTETEVLRWEEVSAAALAAVKGVIDEVRQVIAEGDFKGDPGKSAYESAVDGGYTGTEEEFNAQLATGGAHDVGLSVVDGCVVMTIEEV